MNPYFVTLMDAIDAVFEPLVDQKTEILGNLRNMWVTNPALENNQIANSEMIPFEGWSQPEREILVKQVNMLGMKLQSAGILTNDNYQSISRWVGEYWFGKGTSSFIDFMNYCLSASLNFEQLWTEDYVTFYPTGDSNIGTPLWEGGTWYPTPNVSITVAGGLQNLDVQTLTTFFYEIANYNIVLHNIAITYDIPISTTIQGMNAPVVALGMYLKQAVPISNLYSYGANSPALTITDEVPTAAYTLNPGNTDLTGVYLLGAPTSWLKDTLSRLWPLYDGPQQVPVLETELPTTLCGPVVTGATSAIYGPIQWKAVPSGTYSGGRLPVFGLITNTYTNYIANGNMAGATNGPFVIGQQNPPYWGLAYNLGNHGLTASILDSGTVNGFSYIDLVVSGTPTANGSYFLGSSDVPCPSTGYLTYSGYFELMAGTVAPWVVVGSINSNGVFLGQTQVATVVPTSSMAQVQGTPWPVLPGTATCFTQIYFSYSMGVPVSFTLRIANQQLENGEAVTPYIPTTTGPASQAETFGPIPTSKTAQLGEVPVNVVGFNTYLLVNPTGFAEFVPGSGLYTPYWTAP